MSTGPPSLRLIRTRDVRAAGDSFTTIAKPRDKGAIVRVRTGVYAPAPDWSAMDAQERHRVLVRQTFPLLRSEALASHQSSAAMWRIPILGRPPGQLQVTDVRRGGQSSTHVRHHRVRYQPKAVLIEGVPCTSAGRTAIDLARTLTFPSGLIAVDHVLHQRLSTLEELHATVQEMGKAVGRRRAEVVLEHANGLSESPGESLSRARLIQLGAPLPVLQAEFRDSAGLIGRVDFWWEQLRTVGEFDGAGKYGVGEGAMSVAANEVVYREKVREDRIRAQGQAFVRWCWNDAYSIDILAEILQRHGVLDPLAARCPHLMYSAR